jgi:hypothetical protein
MANTAGQNLSLKESLKISWWLDTVPGLIYNSIMSKWNKKEIWSDILWIGGTTLSTYLFCLYYGYI